MTVSTSPLAHDQRRRRARLVTVVAALLVAATAAGAVLTWFRLQRRHDLPESAELYAVQTGRLQKTIKVRGDLDAAASSDVTCFVKSLRRNATYATTIRWVIDDGVVVKKGQLLAQLDDTEFREDLKDRAGPLELARAQWVDAETNLAIVRSKNDSAVQLAENALALAALDLKRFQQGDREHLRLDLEGKRAQAQADHEMAQERAAWVERMARQGYITRNTARVEAVREANAEQTLDLAAGQLDVFNTFGAPRTLADFRAKVTLARDTLERVQKQAAFLEAQADAVRLSRQRIYQRRLQRYREVEDLAARCTLNAPHDGLVVYASSRQTRSGMGSQQGIIAQGEPVREGQVLIRLPDLSRLVVRTRIHEALSARVRGDRWKPTGFGEAVQAALCTLPEPGSRAAALAAFADLRPAFQDQDRRLIACGQEALIRIASHPDRAFRAHVQSVATVAFRADYGLGENVYDTLVAFDEPVPGARQDMSADVLIFEDGTVDNVLTVPVRAVVQEPGEDHSHCYVVTPRGTEERDIQVGVFNEDYVEVQKGLQAGERVVLNPAQVLPHEHGGHDRPAEEGGGGR